MLVFTPASAGTAREPIGIAVASSVVMRDRKKRVVEAGTPPPPTLLVVSVTEMVAPTPAVVGTDSAATVRSPPIVIGTDLRLLPSSTSTIASAPSALAIRK